MSSAEEKLAEELKAYQNAAKGENKVDLSALMISALERSEQNRLSPSQKRWAYLVSLGMPPLGLLFALKFFLADKDKEDANSAGWVCVILTAFAIIMMVVFMKAFFSTAGTSVQQIEQINPQQVNQLLQ